MATLAVLVNFAAAVSAFADLDAVPSTSLFSPSLSDVTPLIQDAPVSSLWHPGRKPLFLEDAAILHRDLPGLAPGPFSLIEVGELTERATGSSTGIPGSAGSKGGGNDWPWRRAGTAEYVIIPVAAAGTAYFEHENGKPVEAKWTSRNGFDESIRDLLRLDSRGARDATHTASNVIMGLMIGAPVLEPLATLGFRDSRWDRLWQTEVINMESFAFTSLLSSFMQNIIARERPFVRNCVAGKCEGSLENRSMPSGHVAFTFTGAGLLCNHHRFQAIYSGPDAGGAVCAAGVGLAVVDGFLRVMSDRHYTTDVLVGSVIGLFSGFVLPRLLHYSRPLELSDGEGGKEDDEVKLVSVVPKILSGGAALSCDLRF